MMMTTATAAANGGIVGDLSIGISFQEAKRASGAPANR
jgi:hypothetical protein